MNKCKRVVCFVVLAAAPGCVGFRVYQLVSLAQSQNQLVTLRDGGKIELLGYSFGRHHALTLPAPLPTLLTIANYIKHRPPDRVATTDADVLMLWVKIPHRYVIHPGYTPEFACIANGEHGYQFPVDPGEETGIKFAVGMDYYQEWNLFPRRTNVDEIDAICVACYPRRTRQFDVDLYQSNGGKAPLARFHILNPNANISKPFVPDGLPEVKSEGRLSVSVDSITPPHRHAYIVGDGFPTNLDDTTKPLDSVLAPGEASKQQVALSITDNGKATSKWKIEQLEAYDSTGNRTAEFAAAPSWPCRKYYPPCQTEPYRLKIGITKTWDATFEANEVWKIANVPLPLAGRRVSAAGAFNREDLKLRLLSVYGMDGKNFNNDLAILQFRIDTREECPTIFAHVEDERGTTLCGPGKAVNDMFGPGNTSTERENISVYHTGFSGDADSKYLSIPVNIPAGVKHISVTFKLPKTHFFEFNVPGYKAR